MKLLIKPLNDIAMKYYLNHGHFHKGDAGIDLFIPSKIIFFMVKRFYKFLILFKDFLKV